MTKQTDYSVSFDKNLKRPSSKQKFSLSGLSVYLWILPSVILVMVIVFIPILELFRTSFSEVTRSGIIKGLNGFRNYASLFEDGTFLMVLKNTLIWTVVVVGVSTILSMGIAQLLNQNFFGRSVVRSAIIFPWATSLIITASMWKWIFDYNYGTLNLILMNLHIIDKNYYWLAAPSTAFPVVMWAGIFDTMPFTTIVILAGLQAIPGILYEAANIDGANGFGKFLHVTLPMLRQPLTVSTVLNIIYVFNSFPIIWTITRGGPLNQTDTAVTYLYKLAFQVNKIGPSAAVSVIIFLILLAFSILYVSIALRRED
jgi:multiple sugar transport system permease protein